MNIKEFSESVVEILKEKFENYDILLQEVVKNNGMKYHGISIKKKGSNIAPNIYLDKFYEDNKSITETANMIANLYEEHSGDKLDVDVSSIQNFEVMKDKLVIKLVNKNLNKETMETCPFIPFGDLIIIFNLALATDDTYGLASVKVTTNIFKEWGVSIDELVKYGFENTRKLLPLKIGSMIDTLKEMTKEAVPEGLIDDMNEENKMYVVSSKTKMFGSYILSDKESLNAITKEINIDKIYILPSSVHELIILPYSDVYDPLYLQDMVKTVNETSVPVEEILSNNVYIYDSTMEELSVAGTDITVSFIN